MKYNYRGFILTHWCSFIWFPLPGIFFLHGIIWGFNFFNSSFICGTVLLKGSGLPEVQCVEISYFNIVSHFICNGGSLCYHAIFVDKTFETSFQDWTGELGFLKEKCLLYSMLLKLVFWSIQPHLRLCIVVLWNILSRMNISESPNNYSKMLEFDLDFS